MVVCLTLSLKELIVGFGIVGGGNFRASHYCLCRKILAFSVAMFIGINLVK